MTPSPVTAALRWRPGLRLSVAVAAITVVVGLAFLVSETASTQLRLTATESALHNVEAIVRGYVDPTIHERSLLVDAERDEEIVEQLSRVVASGDIRRISIWTRDGRVVYSTDANVRGQRFALGPEVAAAFDGRSVSRYAPSPGSDPQAAAAGEVRLAIYVPIRGTVDGEPLGVYEVYQDARVIEQRVSTTWETVFRIALVASSALLLLVWLAFAGVSRVLGRQNRQLRERATSERLLMIDIRRSEERFRSLVRNSSDCILVARPDSTITYESPAVRQVLGYASEGRLGVPRSTSCIPRTRPRSLACSRTCCGLPTPRSRPGSACAMLTGRGAGSRPSPRTWSRTRRSGAWSSTTAT